MHSTLLVEWIDLFAPIYMKYMKPFVGFHSLSKH